MPSLATNTNNREERSHCKERRKERREGRHPNEPPACMPCTGTSNNNIHYNTN